MKKYFVIISLITLIAMLTASTPNQVLCYDSYHSNWISSDGQYQYPLKIESPAWLGIKDHQAAVDACRIPLDILLKMDTSDLVAMVLSYPLLCEINAYDSVFSGYLQIKAECDAIEELLTRADAYSTLLDTYINYYIPKDRIINYDKLFNKNAKADEINNFIWDISNREAIFSDDRITSGLTVLEMMLMDLIIHQRANANIFSDIYYAKMSEKIASDYYSTESASFLASIYPDYFTNSGSITSIQSYSYTYYVTTPGDGTSVACTYSAPLVSNSSSVSAALIAANPGSVYVTAAYSNFNCHSFAWLQYLYSNEYMYLWMSNSGPFQADSYYTELTSPTATSQIACWGDHSCILTELNKYNPYTYMPEHYCVSKWGSGAIVAHYIKHCPYYNGMDTIYYYYH